MPDDYIQRLPALQLSLERNTPTVPSDGHWYLLHDGKVLDRFRSRPAAQRAWQQFIDASGWKPAKTFDRTPEEMMAIERAARDRDARNEYWHSGRRHV